MALQKFHSIQFSYQDVSLRLKDTLFLKTQLSAVMAKEGVPFSKIQYIFCSDKFLLGLNQRFLNHDTYTDILTFTLSLPNNPIISEIYISAERVKDNAGEMGVDFKDELHRVMIHGLLHLCGYEDDTPSKKRGMRAKEDFYLRNF